MPKDKLKEVAEATFRNIRGWLEKEQGFDTPEDSKATFYLTYDDILIGCLQHEKGTWKFEYSHEFQAHEELRPIVEFPDRGKVYTSKELWPFFALRIPSRKQNAIQKIAETESVDLSDEIQLLKRFGKRTVANPFHLVAT